MPERLQTNWPLKALALVVAFGIWISITGQDRTLRDYTVPLEVDFGTERIAATPPPTTITVRLEGPQTTIRNLDPLRLAVRLDLHDAPLGERDIPLSRSNLTGVPRGVDVSLFDPDRVHLSVAQRSQRELEIVPDFVGDPPAGYRLYGFVARPPVALVEGPQTSVDLLRSLRTETIPLAGRTETFVTDVAVVPENSAVRVIDAGEVAVEVLVDLAPLEAVFDSVPVEIPASLGGSARLATVEVTLAAPPRILEQLRSTPISVVAVLAETGLAGDARVPLRVELRLDEAGQRLVRVRSIRPSEVRLNREDS